LVFSALLTVSGDCRSIAAIHAHGVSARTNPTLRARIGGSTNYATINASGNLTFTNAGVATITGPTTGLTIDATTGALNFGTSANARTITIRNATTTTALALNSGTGDIVLTSTDQVKLLPFMQSLQKLIHQK
ncbi:MAG: hypothetical protein UR20_C0036G0007, partial [Candidatus Woesebacteria bacterium GW2011_GWE2_31_6]